MSDRTVFCVMCNALAVWVRRTQLAGSHFFVIIARKKRRISEIAILVIFAGELFSTERRVAPLFLYFT